LKFVIGGTLTILSWDNPVTAFFRKSKKLRHSLGRPSRSDFVLCQFGTSNGSGTENGYGGRRTLPYVFTEQYGTHQCVLSVRESLLKELRTVAIMI